MPNRDYINGRAAEHRAKQRLEELGYTCFRTAGSKSPCDLIAMWPIPADPVDWRIAPESGIRPLFVQVKNGVRPMPRADKTRFKEFALDHGARPLLIERGNRWTWLDELGEKTA